MNKEMIIKVVAGLLIHNSEILIAKRPPGAHMEGFWEFPGGKVKVGENPQAALERELLEELGIGTETEELLLVTVFNYPEKIVELNFYISKWISKELVQAYHSDVKWIKINEIDGFKFPPPDSDFIKYLKSQSEDWFLKKSSFPAI